jgi:hypothetical protein
VGFNELKNMIKKRYEKSFKRIDENFFDLKGHSVYFHNFDLFGLNGQGVQPSKKVESKYVNSVGGRMLMNIDFDLMGSKSKKKTFRSKASFIICELD